MSAFLAQLRRQGVPRFCVSVFFQGPGDGGRVNPADAADTAKCHAISIDPSWP